MRWRLRHAVEASPPTDAALSFSEAAAISDGGAITGGACVRNCLGYEAFVLDNAGRRFLGALGGYASVGFAINNRSVVVGQADTGEQYPSGDYISVAFLADSAGMRSLGSLAGYANSQAYGVNERNEVVGWCYNLQPFTGATVPDFRAFRADVQGTMRDLGTLGGATAIARAISTHDVIVGGSRIGDGCNRAFVYEQERMTELPSLGGAFAEATGINARRQIVGSASPLGAPARERRAVLWEGDEIRELGSLGGHWGRAWRINSAGDVVGESRTSDGSTHAFLYRDGQMQDLGTLGGRSSLALGISDAGVVVGLSETGAVHPVYGPVQHGFVVDRDGGMRDLAALA